MAYSSQTLQQARRVLEENRSIRSIREQKQQEEIYEKLPCIRQIDMQLRSTVTMAVRAAFASGSDGRAEMERIKEKNLALQQERERLILEHFGPEYIQQSAACSNCSDTGYVGTTMCDCLRRLCSQEQKKQIPMLLSGEAKFENFRLDYYSDQVDPLCGASPRRIMQKTFDACRKYAMGFGKDSGNMLLTGNTGLGKTFLSACIADVVSDRGYSVCYETASQLFDKLEKDRFHPDAESHAAADALYQCDLLILDDLGTEMTSQFVIAALYNLVNDRLLRGKPMVISTNLNIEEIAKRYNPQIASRLRGEFNMRTFVGKDVRIIKNGGF